MKKQKGKKKQLLEKLFMAVAEELLEQVEGVDAEETDEEGNSLKLRPSPAVLSAAIRFLQSNDIVASEEDCPELEAIKNKVLQFRDFKDDEDACIPEAKGGIGFWMKQGN